MKRKGFLKSIGLGAATIFVPKVITPYWGTNRKRITTIEALYEPGNYDHLKQRFDNHLKWAKEVLEGERTNLEIRRAREMRPIIDTVDYLLDIHSMQHRTSLLMMAGMCAKGRYIGT